MAVSENRSRLRLNWREKGCFSLLLFFVVLVVLSAMLPPGHPRQAAASAAMQQSREIALALFQYASDHDGKFPEGNSSTEVFQKLLDDRYASDSALFFYPLAGKTKATTNILTPQNVGWDVTCCVDSQSPDSLPTVFLTGYKVDYKDGGSAIPLVGQDHTYFVAVTYKDNSAKALVEKEPDGSFPKIVPEDFDPHGKTYRQLTPDGPLNP